MNIPLSFLDGTFRSYIFLIFPVMPKHYTTPMRKMQLLLQNLFNFSDFAGFCALF